MDNFILELIAIALSFFLGYTLGGLNVRELEDKTDNLKQAIKTTKRDIKTDSQKARIISPSKNDKAKRLIEDITT